MMSPEKFDTGDSDLRNLIQARHTAGIQPITDALNHSLLPAAIERYNSEFSLRYFGRPPSEAIPTELRELSSFRSRLGALIEYGLGVTFDQFLQEDYHDELRLSFAVASEYPDFYLRNQFGEQLLRIDCKALHDESDEYSARFRVPLKSIVAHDDLLLYVAWRWTEESPAGAALVYPQVLGGLFVPAIDIAEERDRRTTLAGGYISEDNIPFAPKKMGDGFSLDTNFGKIDRIVHTTRRTASDLSPNIVAFLEFTQRHADAVRRAGADSGVASPTPDEIDPS